MTGTPRATASLIAPVIWPASLADTRMALSPSLTACAMRCACTVPSSSGGVSQSILMSIPTDLLNSVAAASAPVRADRKTGLVELLAIIAMRKVFPLAFEGAEPLPQAATAREAARVNWSLFIAYPFVGCHPELSEGSLRRGPIPRYARDDSEFFINRFASSFEPL